MAPCVAKAFDITGFFDNIDHGLLKKRWAELLDETAIPADHYSVFRAITRFAHVDRSQLYQEFSIDSTVRKRGSFRICDIEEGEPLASHRPGKLLKKAVNSLTLPLTDSSSRKPLPAASAPWKPLTAATFSWYSRELWNNTQPRIPKRLSSAAW